MDKTSTTRCPRCRRDIQPDWLSCPYCRASLQTHTTRGKRPKTVRLLVGVIVVLLILLLAVGGMGAWWYFLRPSIAGGAPVNSDRQIAVTGQGATPSVLPTVRTSATRQATATIARGTLILDPALVSLSVSSDKLAENGGSVIVTAHLSRVNASDVSVHLEFSGSAKAGKDDYTVSSNVIIIPAGTTSSNSLITGIRDSDIEGDETIIIKIGAVDNAARSDMAHVTVTIVQSNPGPNLILVASPVTIAEAGGQAQVTLVVSEAHSEDIGINLSFGGSAKFGSDYHSDSRFILISAGNRTGTPATITGLPDNVVEGEEVIRVSIESITSGSHDTYVCSKSSATGQSIPSDRAQLGSAALNEQRAGCLVVDFRTIIIKENRNNKRRSISSVITGAGLHSHVIWRPYLSNRPSI